MRGPWSQQVNCAAANLVLNLGRVRGGVRFADVSAFRDGTPEDLYNYTLFVGGAWCALSTLVGLLTVGLDWVLTQIAGSPGHTVGVAVLIFGQAFCLTAIADDLWRHALAQAARRNYRRSGEEVDTLTRRLVAIARFDDRTPLLQLVVAALATWYLA